MELLSSGTVLLPLHACFLLEVLPVPANVVLFFTVGVDIDVLGAHEATSESLREQRNWFEGKVEGRKRFRLTRKKQKFPVHPGKGPGSPIPRRWKRLHSLECDQHFAWPKRLCQGTAFSVPSCKREVRLGIG